MARPFEGTTNTADLSGFALPLRDQGLDVLGRCAALSPEKAVSLCLNFFKEGNLPSVQAFNLCFCFLSNDGWLLFLALGFRLN